MNVTVKGRGHTTWGRPKKPYQIKFDSKVDLLGLGKAKKWILLANDLDVTNMRNDIALAMAEMLGREYDARGRFVELYFNGDYTGLYYLINKVEISKASVDLRGDGGVLFELDTLHDDAEQCYKSVLSDCLILQDSVSKDVTVQEEAAVRFVEDFDEFELFLLNKDYEGVKSKIDVKSFAEYYIINEFAVNPDAYSSSFYLYKPDFVGKIYAGPVWDFDLAFANREWGWQVDEEYFSPNRTMIRRREAFGEDGLNEDTNISKVLYYLMDFAEFREEVAKIFRENLAGRLEELLLMIRGRVESIEKAAEINNAKWQKEGAKEETEEMLEWIRARYNYFEQEYGDGQGGMRMLLSLNKGADFGFL